MTARSASSTYVTSSDGTRLSVRRTGGSANPTVVLVHGFPDDHTAWDGVVDRLAAEFDVVTYDTRGTGASSHPQHIRDYRLDLLAEDLQAVVDAVNTGEGVHLVGHDWGSVQAWHLVTDAHQRGVLSFTSISGPCIDHVPDWVRSQWKAGRYRDVAAMWKSPLYMGLFSIPLLAPLLARLGVFDPSIRLSLRMFERPENLPARPAGPNARRNADSIRIYAANVFPRLARPERAGTDIPVQVLTPQRDIFVPPITQTGRRADVPTFVVRTVPGGHWAPTYNPAAVSGHIRDWVQTHPRADDINPATKRKALP